MVTQSGAVERPQPPRRRALALLPLLLGLAPLPGRAECARPLVVPVAAIGYAVTVDADNRVGGIYPELLRAEAARAGCTIDFQVVPRARQEMLFETGQADLLLPARRSTRRDVHGLFVSMIRSRAMLLSIQPRPVLLHSLAELLAHPELRVGVVRGYDYDEVYHAFVAQFSAQDRLTEASDPVSLARMLDAGIVDVAIVTPMTVTGVLRNNPKLSPLIERLHAEAAKELSWGESGAYVSRTSSLSDADRQRVEAMLERIGRSGAAWRAFQRYYPDRDLGDSVRGR